MKFLYLLALIVIPFISYSQNSDVKEVESKNKTEEIKYRTLFGSPGGKTKVSGFGSFNIDLLSMDGKTSGALGMDGAVLLNRSIYLGLYGRGTFGSPSYDIISADSNSNLEKSSSFIHGGFIIGVNFVPERPVHFGFSTKFGGGAILLYDSYDYYHSCNTYKCNYYDHDVYVSRPVFVITPQVDVEMNLTNWMKLKIGLGYQWVNNSELSYNYLNSDNTIETRVFETGKLSSPTAEISFVFGWFK